MQIGFRISKTRSVHAWFSETSTLVSTLSPSRHGHTHREQWNTSSGVFLEASTVWPPVKCVASTEYRGAGHPTLAGMMDTGMAAKGKWRWEQKQSLGKW